MYGLFNEHHEEYQTLWNGNEGRVYMYQSEMPYDVPNQAAWVNGKTAGYCSYKVADSVTSHEAWGVGVYCFFRDAPVKANSAIEAPSVPGVKFHSLTTVWLDGKPGSEIAHIINNVGSSVTRKKSSEVSRETMTEFHEKRKSR
jgi:predicted heme/steroid binding protein